MVTIMLLSEALGQRIDMLSELIEEHDLHCECVDCIELNSRYIELRWITEGKCEDVEGAHARVLKVPKIEEGNL